MCIVYIYVNKKLITVLIPYAICKPQNSINYPQNGHSSKLIGKPVFN